VKKSKGASTETLDDEAELAAAMQSLQPGHGGSINPDADRIVWEALGIRGDSVGREQRRNSPFSMGILISEVRPNSPAAKLSPGDMIVGLHRWQTPTKPRLAWALLQPLSRNIELISPTARGTIEEATLYVLRDDEPRSIPVVLPPWPLVSSPEASNEPRIASPGATDGQSLILRTADEFGQRLREAEKVVDQIKAQFDPKRVRDPVKARAFIDQQLREPQRRLDFIREEYAAQLRLLELDLQDAQSVLDSAASRLAATKAAFEKSPRSSVLRQTEQAEARAEAAARLRVEKAKTLLELYRKADPKSATADPPDGKEKSTDKE
jgi:hypothetical protein